MQIGEGDEMSRLVKGSMGLPMCAVCCKPVEKIEWMDDPMRWLRRFRVSCHGQVEEGELTDLQVLDAKDIGFWVAFERPALERPA